MDQILNMVKGTVTEPEEVKRGVIEEQKQYKEKIEMSERENADVKREYEEMKTENTEIKIEKSALKNG